MSGCKSKAEKTSCVPKETCCKSCGMPMKKPEDFGVNSDGTINKEFCRNCLKKGKKS